MFTGVLRQTLNMLRALLLVYTVFLGAVFGEKLVVPEHLRGPAAILQHTCQMESKLSDESIAIARTGVLPQDREFRCHLDCMLDKVGMYNEDHTIDPSIVWHMVPDSYKPKLTAVFDTCQTIHGSDRCETAYLTLKCYMDTDSDVDITEWFTHVVPKK